MNAGGFVLAVLVIILALAGALAAAELLARLLAPVSDALMGAMKP